MAKSKAELQEELELVTAELAATKAALDECQEESRKALQRVKAAVKKQADQLDDARKKIYEEAKVSYTNAIATAREIASDFEKQVPENLGQVAQGVREQVLYTLKQVFGNDL